MPVQYIVTIYKDSGDKRGTLSASENISASSPKVACGKALRIMTQQLIGKKLGPWNSQKGQITIEWERQK